MKDEHTPKIFSKSLEDFFALISSQKELNYNVDEDCMLYYNALWQKHGPEQLQQWLQWMEEIAGHSFTNNQVIQLLRTIDMRGWDVVKLVLPRVTRETAIEEVGELLDSIQRELQEKKEAERQQQLAYEAAERKKQEEEDAQMKLEEELK